MNKLLTKIAGLALGLSMAIGVGVAASYSGKDAIRADAAVTPDPGYTAATMAAGTNGSACTVDGEDGIKVGTSKAGGNMTVTVPANATDLRIYAGAWKGVSGLSLNITGASVSPSSVSLSADNGFTNNSPFTLSGNKADYCFDLSLSGIVAETTITFSSSTTKRFVLWDAQYKSQGTTTPTLTLDKTEMTVGLNESETFTVTTQNLTSAFTVTSDDAAKVSVKSISPAASKDDGVYTVTLFGEAITSSNVDVVVASTGAESKSISIDVLEKKEFTKISMVSELVDGGHYIISNSGTETIMSTNQGTSGNNRGYTSATPIGESDFSKLITTNSISAILEMNSGTDEYADYYTIYDPVNDGYYYAVNGSNYLKIGSSISGDVYYWSISFNSGHVVLMNKGANEYSIQYNSSNKIFSCYKTSQTPIDLYLLSSEIPSDIDITQFTMPSGSISFENLDKYQFVATYVDPAANETVTASVGTGSVGNVTFGAINMSNGTLTVEITGESAGLVNIVLTADRSGTTASKTVTIVNSSRIYSSGKLVASSVSTALGGSVTTNNVTWYTNDATMQNPEDSFATSTDSDRGVGLGTNAHPVSSFEMTSDLLVGQDCASKGAHLISSIIVNACVAKDGSATLSVELDGTQIGSSASLTTTATDYSFNVGSYNPGHITIKVANNAAKSVYIGSIIVKGYFDNEDSEVYYSMAKQLEAIDSCNVSQFDWETFLATEDSYFEMTYGEIFEASQSDFAIINLFDHASKDSESLKTETWDAYSKYIYINSRFESGSGVKLFSLFDDPNTSITIIVAISAISLTSVGAFFALRKRKENI